MLGFFRGNKNQREEEMHGNLDIMDNDNELALYILTERYVPNLAEKAAKCGLYINEIFNNIEETKVAMLIETRPSRLVIVESGLGKFTRTTTRQELVDLIGLCDVDKKVAVFYTNSLIKSEVQKVLTRRQGSISWYYYKGTMDVLEKLLELGEKYIKVDIKESSGTPDYNKLNYIGKPVELEVDEAKIERGGTITEPWEIISKGEPLNGFGD